MFDKLLGFSELLYRQAAAKRRLDAESRRERIQGARVLSVGNLTLGGTGKTPAVQWAARALQNDFALVAVVSRGHGGQMSRESAIVSDGSRVFIDDAAQVGDEALLHARALPGVAVVIGRDRVAACRRAVEECGADLLILDDGYQYWSLQRDFDLLLLDARRPFDNGFQLPKGRLREAAHETARADAVLLTRVALASAKQLDATRNAVTKHSRAPLYVSDHAPQDLRNERDGAIDALNTLQSVRVGALSAIADNDAFARLLRDQGADVVFHLRRRDHHAWREAEVREAVQNAKNAGAQMLLTTEKDAVKLRADWCDLALWSLRIALRVENEAALLTQIRGALNAS